MSTTEYSADMDDARKNLMLALDQARRWITDGSGGRFPDDIQEDINDAIEDVNKHAGGNYVEKDPMLRELSSAVCYCFSCDDTTALEDMIKSPYVTPSQMKEAIQNAESHGFSEHDIVRKAKEHLTTITVPEGPAHYTHGKLVDVIQHLQYLVYEVKQVSAEHLEAAVQNMERFGLQNYGIYTLAKKNLAKMHST